MAEKYVDWVTMEHFVTDVFVGSGVPVKDAKICTDVLLEADRRGIDSHGINRFKPIYIDRIKAGIQNPVTKFEIVKETPTTAVVDGHDGMGQVIAYQAMEIAIAKAKKFGMGMTAVRNSTHYGIAGYYATMATKADCIGFTGTNARPSIAPTFGIENMLGTNPMTFGLPTDEDFPFVIDCATSISQRGKIEKWERLHQDTPPGLVITCDGTTMTDSAAILDALIQGNAAFAPLGGIGEEFAGYKGYSYAVVIEILSAALQAGNYMKMLSGIGESGEKVPYHLGHFFMAVDTNAFEGADVFKKTAGEILRQLRASKTVPAQQKIYTAGEKEYLHYLEAKEKGVLVNEAVQKELLQLQQEYGLTQYHFNFH